MQARMMWRYASSSTLSQHIRRPSRRPRADGSRMAKMRIGIYSTMAGMPWGGSEELWSRAATALLRQGHQVSVNYKRRKEPVARLEELKGQGAEIFFRHGIRVGRMI